MGDRKKGAKKVGRMEKKRVGRRKKAFFDTTTNKKKNTGLTMGDDNDGENNNLLHGCAGYGAQGRLGGRLGVSLMWGKMEYNNQLHGGGETRRHVTRRRGTDVHEISRHGEPPK